MAGGSALSAMLNNPTAVVVDGEGNVYIADTMNALVRKVDVNGIISTFAGGGSSLGDGGLAANARMSAPAGLAVDAADNLFISDGSSVREVMAATRVYGSRLHPQTEEESHP